MPGSYAKDLAEACAAARVTGASFAYWDGETLHTAVTGLRNSVTGDPVTADTVMHIGSITKVMNAVLLLQLVDEGRIALEDSVTKHVPELHLRDMEALGRMTCAMLVNHTSGINCDWLPEYGPDQERIIDAIERCADLGQLHEPAQAASYCNMATVIAGHLVQRIRGTSWYTLVKSRIFEPLGLHHALVDPLDVPRFRCSVGDVLDFASGGLVQTQRPFLAPSFAPAGSTCMTSAADLVTFARALIAGGVGPNGGRILSAASSSRMMEPTAAILHPVGWHWGLGWKILPGKVLNHSGGGRGVFSQLYAHPESGRAAALLTNCDLGGDLERRFLAPIIASWVGASTTPPGRSEIGPVDAAPYQGVYANNLTRCEVLARDGRLEMRQGPNGSQMADLFDSAPSLTATLHARGDDVFEVEYTSAGLPRHEIRFVQPDASGRMRFLASGLRLRARTQ
jgi:CubicO group peptidase (beta-lactamase class C family)